MNLSKLDITIINKLEEFITNGNIKTNKSYFLDKLNITDFTSKIVYNIAINNQIINENFDKYTIEFNFVNTNEDNKFDIVYDKLYYKENSIKKSPEVTILTYINGNSTLYMTNINNNKYNYKDFNSGELTVLQVCKSFILSHNNFYNKNIYNGDGNSYILTTNLWIDKPTNAELYIPNKQIFTYTDTEMTNIIYKYDFKNKIINSNIVDYNLFNRLLYHNDLSIIDNYIRKNYIKIDNMITIHNNIINQNNNEINNNNNSINKTTITVLKDRFIQRFICKNIFCDIVCKWLIFEFNIINDKNKTNEKIININDIPNVKYFILRNFQTIIDKINNFYNIPYSIFINVDYINIVEHNVFDDINNYHDNSSILHIHIPLNCCYSDYQGGSYSFDDNITHNIIKGDMFVFLNNNSNRISPIYSGKKYYLFAGLSYDSITKET